MSFLFLESKLVCMWEVIASLATFALGLVGGHYLWQKGIKSAKEFSDVINSVLRAVEDGRITEAEVKQIVKEAREFIRALRE